MLRTYYVGWLLPRLVFNTFRALLAHLQEALNKQLVYCVRVVSVGCYQGWSSTLTLVAASRRNTHAIYQFLFMQRMRTTSLDTTRPSTIFYRLLLN
jgi:hypothetical protein